jgi:hypothetical protein
MFDEQLLPDEVGLLSFGQLPELLIGHVHISEHLRDEIMIRQQIVDSPQQQFAEGRIVEVGMDVKNRRGKDGPVHPGGEARMPAFLDFPQKIEVRIAPGIFRAFGVGAGVA